MFVSTIARFLWAIHCLVAPMHGDQSMMNSAPDPESSSTIFTSLGIGLTVENISVEGRDLVCRLVCVDRTGLVEPLLLGILSSLLYDTQTLATPIDPTGWEIGSLVTIKRALPEGIPLGAIAVTLSSSERLMPLGELTLYTEPHLPLAWQGWFFRRLPAERVPLLEALETDLGVGLAGEMITFGCHRFPTPSDVVGVEGTFRVKIGEPVTIGLEIQDSYRSVGMQGSLEQRVYANDVLISRHDVGGDLSLGWYAVDTTIVSTTDPLLLRVEVVPLRVLGAWGWYKASRTSVRNVHVVP